MLRYIFGGPGSGKTTLCADEILSEQDSNSDASGLIYIAPEQFSLNSERLLLVRSKGRGLFRAQVLSFNRLAYSVFQETGRPVGVVLDDVGRSLVIGRVLTTAAPGLEYYKSRQSIRSQGFVEKLGRLITELRQYQVSPETLAAAAERLPAGKEALRLRLLDLSAIYGCYGDYLRDRYITGEETLDVLAARIPVSRGLAGASVWIDGFKSFTPQEITVIKALLAVCRQVSVALPLDVNSGSFYGRFNSINETDPFAEIKATVNCLSQIAMETDATIGPHVFLKGSQRFGAIPSVAFLTREYFNISGGAFDGDTSNVFLTGYDSVADETEGAAQTITTLVRDRGYRFGEIGVALADPALYGRRLKSVCDRYGIAIFMDEKRDMLAHPLTELCLAAMAVAAGGFTYENVFRAIKTGLLPISKEDADKLENYVLAYGIGRRGWEKEWQFGFGGDDSAFNELNVLRCQVLAFFTPLTEAFSPKARFSVKDGCKALYNFLLTNGVKETLAKRIEAAMTTDPDAARTHRQIWNHFTDILDEAVLVLGTDQVTAQELSAMLSAGFAGFSAGVAPPTLDHVTVGDVRRSRLGEVKALIVIGVNQGLLPAPPMLDGLLSDSDREALKEQGVTLAGTALEQAVSERLGVYQILTKVTERLYLSYHTQDAAGREAFPSSLAGVIKRKLPGIGAVDTNGVNAIFNAKAMLGGIYGKLRESGADPEQNAVYRETLEILVENNLIDRPGQRGPSIEKLRLNDGDITAIYGYNQGLRLRTSVTRLESFARCPFMHYARYGLGLKERKVYEIEKYDVGMVLHDVIDRFTNWLVQGADGSVDEALTRFVTEAATDSKNAILLNNDRYRFFTDRIGNIAGTSVQALMDHLSRGDFSILETEIPFESDNAVTLELGGGKTAELTGRVDRVDVVDRNGRRYAKIIDYKSGNQSFSFAAMYNGLQLQLAVYLRAFMEMYSESAIPAAILIFNVANPMVVYQKGMDDTDIRREVMRNFRMSGVVSGDTETIRMLDRDIDGWSNIIPVALTANGEPYKNTITLSQPEFGALVQAVSGLISDMCDDILNGEITPFPLMQNNSPACGFCEYHALCGHDGDRYRLYKKISEKEALDRLLSRAGHEA